MIDGNDKQIIKTNYDLMLTLFKKLKELENMIPNGSHPTKLVAVKSILNILNIHRTEIVWEIGVGVPKLALYLASLSNVVYATDICEYLKIINVMHDVNFFSQQRKYWKELQI